jgi:hypothetical protein
MIRSSRQGVWWITVGAALALAASVPGAGTREARADPLLDVPFASATGCTYLCRVCPGPKGDRHDIVVATTSNAQSSHLETCNEGNCAAHACDVDQMPAGGLGALWFEVREERDAGRLRELLREHAAVALYNPERDAVQVRGCSGSVLASIPLTAGQVALLEE